MRTLDVVMLWCVLLTTACQDMGGEKYRKDPIAQSDDATPREENLSKDSLAAFQTTVHPIMAAHCGSCHGKFQAPMFAVEDAPTAHANLMESAKVDLMQPDRSRLVTRLREDRHNCWSDCAADAQTVQDAIAQWAAALGPPPETDKAMTTAELTVAEATDQLTRNTDARTIVMEAETLTREGLFQSAAAVGASDGNAVGVANDGANPEKFDTFDVATDILRAKVTVPADGNYQLWVRAKAPSANDDELFYRFADATFTGMLLRRTNGDAWAWTAVNANNAGAPAAAKMLAAGEHEIEFRRGEAGAYIDMIAITSDDNFRNSALGAQKLSKTLTYDISALCNAPQVTLEIEISDFNAEAYKFLLPRVRTASKTVHIKSLDVVVNGATNPQYATYRLVDKTVRPGDYGSQLLSGGALLVLKENGPDADRFAFALGSCQAE